MNRGPQIVVVTFALMVLGAVLIKGCNNEVVSDPTASVTNGAPRGLLGLRLLLAQKHSDVVVVSRFTDRLPPAGHNVIVEPPPEATSWTEADAKDLLERVKAGDRALVFCDDDEVPRTHRLEALLDAVGVECERADVPIGDETLSHATGTMPRYRRALYVRGEGRVKQKEKDASPLFPAWMSGSDDVVMKRAFGKGLITVVGSATIAANDGIAKFDNAAFVLDELEGSAVVFDERFNTSRSKDAFLAAAVQGTGPITALFALLALIPLSLLSLAPRPGDPPPPGDDDAGAPAAEAQARALASLLVRRRKR